jgi:hypothetical protein
MKVGPSVVMGMIAKDGIKKMIGDGEGVVREIGVKVGNDGRDS